jgi:hypothetical protein
VKETEVAAAVVEHFDLLGEVFPEVQVWAYGNRADVVVVRDDASIDVCEVKARATRSLLWQIQRWRDYCERRWVAFEPARSGAVSQHWLERFKAEGVGVLHVVRGIIQVAHEAPEAVADSWHRPRLTACLDPLHRVYGVAGSACGQYFTPFRETCHRLRLAVEKTPGLSIGDAVGRISHHYTSDKVARSSLMQWLRKGRIAGLEVRKNGRRCELYATAPTSPEGT